MKLYSLPLSFVLTAFAAACSSSSSSGAPTPEPGDAGSGGEEGGTGGSQCTAARDATLRPVDKVSTGAVSVVSDDGTTKVLYIDASAGGISGSSKNPAVYVSLEAGARVDVTDKSALESTEWDLSLKRSVIYTNGGDGGPGSGGAAKLTKSFDAVTAADGQGLSKEVFFDEECNANLDQANFLRTTFSPDWYEYDASSNGVTPKALTFVVAGGTGKTFKIQITSFTGKPDGSTTAPSGGYFLMKVAPL